MIRIGILFGGPSREREISFAGGRTVYDNLNKNLFEPVPLFVDSSKNLAILDWEYIYKGSIRDFYPPLAFRPKSKYGFQIYEESITISDDHQAQEMLSEVGQLIDWKELTKHIDFAFLVLHGEFGEDGQVQALLESLNIPYSGSDILASAIGMNKGFQKRHMMAAGWHVPENISITHDHWINLDRLELFEGVKEKFDGRYVVRPSNQGSSIGLSIDDTHNGFSSFEKAINKAFFRWDLNKSEFPKEKHEQIQFVAHLTDIKEGPGFPMKVDDSWISHPDHLLDKLRSHFEYKDQVRIEASQTDHEVLVETFIEGKEFSCIVIRDDQDQLVALPPTEIRKQVDLFDYRSKYLPGFVRKITPIQIEEKLIELICEHCKNLFEFFEFKTYARIDGFIQEDGTIYLNDPNTTSGMLPSSFFFHQAAQIGLSPSEIITVIIRSSLEERRRHTLVNTRISNLIDRFEVQLDKQILENQSKIKVGVIMGGYSFERHISVESGRNIYEKLASSSKYKPIPLFLVGNDSEYQLYRIPISLLLKDNADDIRDSIITNKAESMLPWLDSESSFIRNKYGDDDLIIQAQLIPWKELSSIIDIAFIALHGRPGEDGSLQIKLDQLDIPYNGSSQQSSAITINKFDTGTELRKHGLLTAKQRILSKVDYLRNKEQYIDDYIEEFGLPLISKPIDDGCSSAVMIIKNRNQLIDYCEAIFRNDKQLSNGLRDNLGLSANDEFPMKHEILIESLIGSNGASKFIEITAGMLTKWENGKKVFELFEPSEALATDDILSLEEKFLAGQGQNITPARFDDDTGQSQAISDQVKLQLKKAAEILNIEGYCRIDAFVRIFQNGHIETIFIEVNSLPGMTPATCIFHQTALAGLRPYDFIDKILDFSRLKPTLA